MLLACHAPPREVRTPRAFRASAMPLSEVMPAAWTDLIVGTTFIANELAARALAAAPSCWAWPRLVRLPSFVPAAFFARRPPIKSARVRARGKRSNALNAALFSVLYQRPS